MQQFDPLSEQIKRTVRDAVAEAIDRTGRPVQREALSVREAGEALGMSEQYVRNLITAGEIPAVRAGLNGQLLVSVHALRRWLGES